MARGRGGEWTPASRTFARTAWVRSCASRPREDKRPLKGILSCAESGPKVLTARPASSSPFSAQGIPLLLFAPAASGPGGRSSESKGAGPPRRDQGSPSLRLPVQARPGATRSAQAAGDRRFALGPLASFCRTVPPCAAPTPGCAPNLEPSAPPRARVGPTLSVTVFCGTPP